MQLTLLELRLKDFKGVKEETYVFDGVSSIIQGHNGSGKTTIMDAYFFLFSNCSSNLRSNPDIRPIGVEECTPRVEAVIDIDGKKVTVVKQQKRTVSKPNADGISKIALTNTYEINSVPKSERDFKQYLEDLGFSFDRFLPLSHADVFSAQKTADMRKALFDMAELMSDAEIAERTEDVDELKELLTNYNLEEITAMQKATLRKINEDYGKVGEILRAKIEGLESGKVDIDVSAMELGKADAARRLQDVRAKISEANSPSEEQKKAATDYEEAKSIAFEIAENYKRNIMSLSFSAQNRLNEIKREISKIHDEKSNLDSTITHIQFLVDRSNERIAKLDAELDKVSCEEFSAESAVCPTCGRNYPPDKITALKGNFEAQKANHIKDIVTAKAQIAHDSEGNEELLADTRKRMNDCNSSIASLLVEQDELVVKLSEIQNTKPVSEDEDYKAALKKVESIKARLDSFTHSQRDILDTLRDEEAAISAELIEYERAIASYANNERIDAQIEDLRNKQIVYEQNRADAEKILYQVSLLNKRMNELLTEDINKHFKYVKWVLFRYAKNGNYEDCCIATIDGKELGVSTNNALGIKAKVDICNGMQRYYGQSYPILLDNVEAIDSEGRKTLVSDSQLIMFAVTDTALMIGEA